MLYKSVMLIVASSIFASHGAVTVNFKRFTKEMKPAGRKIFGPKTEIMPTASSLLECASKCYEDIHCHSFLYNQEEEVCHTMDRMHVDFGQDPMEDGAILYDVQQGECEVPKASAVPNGRVLFSFFMTEDSNMAEYQCDDHYFPTTAYGVCDSSTGTWTGFSCLKDPDQDYNIPIRDKFYLGSCVNIIATPTSLSSFLINFKEANGDISFGNEIKFNKDGDVDIVSRNSNFGGVDGTFEKDTPIFPFGTGQEFDIAICANDTHYTVTSDGDELYRYDYRNQLYDLDILEISGGVTTRRVRFMY